MNESQQKIKLIVERLNDFIENSQRASYRLTRFQPPLAALEKIREVCEISPTLKDMKSISRTIKIMESLTKSARKELLTIQWNCEHLWRYDGHSHNDDVYECLICGETEHR